jgi:hypothetical protein
MVSVIISAAAGWLSPRDRPAGWPGSSRAVLISTSLKALGELPGRHEIRRDHIDHPRGGFALQAQEPGYASHVATHGKLERVRLLRRAPGGFHVQVVALGLEPEPFGDARVGLQPSELGDVAAQLDADRARLTFLLGDPSQEGAAALAADQQSAAHESSYCRPDGRPGHAQVSHELGFRGNPVADPVLPVYQQVLQNLLGLGVQGHPAQRGGSIPGSFRAGSAGISRHTLMLGNRHAV